MTGLPKPPVDIVGACSVVHDDTLYVFSPTAFQSLELKEGGEWEQLDDGVQVTGGQCVKVIPQGDDSKAALYVVGGTTSDPNYPGLQKFVFEEKKWETVNLPVPVTQNRVNHGSAYLNASSSILVYAGSQTSGDRNPSSQTFVISTLPPYSVQAFNSQAPPLVSPMLMPWDDSRAVLVGGSGDNTKVFTFAPAEGWVDLGTQLVTPLGDPAAIQCTIMSGDDGSRVLEIYDMGVSPNTVTRYALLTAGGRVAEPGTLVGPPSRRKRKRDLTVSNWPAYNSSLAPESTRTDYSIAQDPRGWAVVSGGNTDDPFCIFNQRDNEWINATEVLRGKSVEPQVVLDPSSSATSPIPFPSSTASSLPSSAPTVVSAAGSGQPKSRVLTVLGATLGVIFGIAAVVIILLLLLRWKKLKNKKRAGSPKAEYPEEKGGRLSFADRGLSFHTEMRAAEMRAANALAAPKLPSPQNGSHSSLAIMTGRFMGNSPKSNNGRSEGHIRRQASDASTANLVMKHNNKDIELARFHEPLSPASPTSPNSPSFEKMQPRLEKSPPPVVTQVTSPDPTYSPAAPPYSQFPPRQSNAPTNPSSLRITDTPPPLPQTHHDRQRSSGWSRYFNNNETTNLAALAASGRTTYASENSDRDSASHYTDSRILSSVPSARHPDPSMMPPPLTSAPKDSSRVVAPLSMDFTAPTVFAGQGQRLSQVASGSPTFSNSREDLSIRGVVPQSGMRAQIESRRSSISSLGVDEINPFDNETPSVGTSTWMDRTGRGDDGRSVWNGGKPAETPRRPVSSLYDDLSSPPLPRSTVGGGGDRDSNVTVFPGGIEGTRSGYFEAKRVAHLRDEAGPPRQVVKKSSNDMSWLNLGESR